jgi:hypothetical protein
MRGGVAAFVVMVIAVPAVIVASLVMVTSFARYNDARGGDHRSADDFSPQFSRAVKSAEYP